MKLHDNAALFGGLIRQLSEKSGIRSDVIEKDYYVMQFLRELAELQNRGLRAYFKGGTAVYKMLHDPKRFSEDIDISVDVEGMSRTQAAKVLKSATKRYKTLMLIDGEGRTNRSEIEAVYGYAPCVSVDRDDELQRFGKVKIEATSFTIAEPVETILASELIYDLADDMQKGILKKDFGLTPLPIEAISLERIFIDKIFASESYVNKSHDDARRGFEAAKHIYDLCVMVDLPRINQFISDNQKLGEIIDIRRKEEIVRLDGVGDRPTGEFTFFEGLAASPVAEAFERMCEQYVFNQRDAITFTEAVRKMKELGESLGRMPAWGIKESLRRATTATPGRGFQASDPNFHGDGGNRTISHRDSALPSGLINKPRKPSGSISDVNEPSEQYYKVQPPTHHKKRRR